MNAMRTPNTYRPTLSHRMKCLWWAFDKWTGRWLWHLGPYRRWKINRTMRKIETVRSIQKEME